MSILCQPIDTGADWCIIGAVLALLVIGALILAGNLAAGITAVVVYRRLARQVKALVTPVADGELSPIALVTHALAQDFARALVIQVKQAISAPATHMVRQENAIKQELTQAVIQEEAPQWGALLGLLPKNVQKRVLGNPAAAAALVGLLGKMGTGGSAGTGAGNGQKSSVQMRLKNLT